MLRLCLLVALCTWSAPFASGDSFHYEDNNARFIELLKPRVRRAPVEATTPVDIGNDEAWKIPEEYEQEEDQKTEHVYYTMTIFSNKPEMLKDKYVDVGKWMKEGKGVVGHEDHPSLQESYRKAAAAPIGFSFPFYGHLIQNLTIATGGFCYVGDQTHSWLAATQYVAPLMANFDTVAESANITYATDNKSKMIISWNNVQLRDNPTAGSFNFQVHLLANGDIWFVYKDVPISIKEISDAHHPCKLGISDAYLFNHKFGDKSSTQMKRVIHEYHRIQVPPESVTNNTVIILKALPTCLQFTDCQSCVNSSLLTFNCSWCSPKASSNASAFCSDQAGLHRKRQDWVEGDCAFDRSEKACPAPTAETTPASSTTTQMPPVTAPAIDEEDAKKEKEKSAQKASSGGGSGMAFFTVFILLVLAAICWGLYAFYNPHTTSGQLLIKYRPSKWTLPSGHVRYSATSVHM